MERKCVQYMSNIVFPLGIDSFEKIRTEGYYYIDKTEIIAELLRKTFEVNLITRPRRFGKTLAMDTMASFFDIRKDTRKLFSGLHIEKYKEICGKWQNQWPVLFLSLKEVDDKTFDQATKKLAVNISDLYKEHTYLLKSNKVDPADAELFNKIRYQKADSVDIQNALYILMRMMQAYFGKQVIVLIDEYDVPLAKASENGFYDDMLNVVRGLLGKTLKTNPFLKFAVITGCLRIAQESIFTGTNNFVSDTITGERFNEYFGFTEEDVHKLLQDTGYGKHFDEIKYWYNGYRFGSIDIYCPWDVLNHVNALQDNPDTEPKSYWEDTSHNGILRVFIELANSEERQDLAVNDKFEALLGGDCIEEPIEQNLTYDTLHSSESNLWSLLYLTGYLTQAAPISLQDSAPVENGRFLLKIPNEEVKLIFRKTVVEWFHAKVATVDRSELFRAMWEGNAQKATVILSDLLFNTISYHDYKEDFYHAFIAGVFTGAGYYVESNREHGTGRTDIVVRDRSSRRVMIIEAKRANAPDLLEAGCRDAVRQIDDRRYAAEFVKGYRSVICYGIAFYNKECLVMKFGTAEN